MQKIVDLSTKNSLWANSNFWAEEQLSGIQVTVTITPTHNLIESGDEKIHHCFHNYRDMKLHDAIGDSIFSGVLVSPEGVGRRYLKTLMNSGALGSEKLQQLNGSIKLVLTDVQALNGVSFTYFKFCDRRIYLESLSSLLLEKGIIPSVVISDVIKKDTEKFFKFVCDRGARGIILKDSNGLLEDKIFKVAPRKPAIGLGNVTLSRGWQALPKVTELTDSFDFDSFLAMSILNKPSNKQALLAFR